MSYIISIQKKAVKSLELMPKIEVVKINECIQKLKTNPRPPKCKKLTSKDELYRIRVGNYRIIYSIHDRNLIVEIVKIGHRKSIYQ